MFKYIFLVIIFLMLNNTKLLYAQWVQTSLPNMTVYALAVSPNGFLIAGTENGVYRSADSGTNWDATPVTGQIVFALAASDTNLFASANGFYRSTNDGASWVSPVYGISGYTLAVSPNNFGGTNLFTGNGYGVFLSTNNGTNWAQILAPPAWTLSLAISSSKTEGTTIFAGVGREDPGDSRVYRSNDNGTTWSYSEMGGHMITALAVSPTGSGSSDIFAGSWYVGVALSTDNGVNWIDVSVGLTNTAINAFEVCDTNIFAGSCGDGVFLSTNKGASWTPVNSGLPNYSFIKSFIVTDTYLFAGFLNGGVWRRPLSEMITSVEGTSDVFPTQFSLEQNYPNPFNPSTTIRFQVPNSSFVNLKVYDVLGNEVATLVSEEKPAGSYEVKFDAAGLSSGIYFYKFQAGSLVETKKMILLK
jgi:hypothetical protein